MAGASISMVGNDEIDYLGHTAPPSVGLPDLVDGSIPSMPPSNQLLNRPPHKLSPVVLLLDPMAPIATFTS